MNQRGIALIITMLVIATVATLAMEFAQMARLDAGIARNAGDDMRAYLMARSSLSWAQGLLKRDIKNSQYDSLEEEWAKEVHLHQHGTTSHPRAQRSVLST